MTTEYNYHHGYWDGGEREFRGFGRVDQRDTETFNLFNSDNLHDSDSFRPVIKPRGDWELADFDSDDFLTAQPFRLPEVAMNRVDAAHFSPPTETRTWFHLGPLGDEHGEWYEADFTREYWQEDQPAFTRPLEMELLLKKLPRRAKRDAYRALRGSVLRTELYAMDGTARQKRPYTVTESLTGVAEVRTVWDSSNNVVAPELSFNGTYNANALAYLTEQRIFFACGLGQRTTQWERGSEPMTQFSFTGNYDHYGQAKEQISIAVPRHFDFRIGNWTTPVTAPLNRYLATASVTEYAYKNTAALYFTDRVTRTTGYDVSATAALPVIAFKNGIETELKRPGIIYPVTGQTIHYYDGSDLDTLPQFNTLGLHGALTATEVLMLTDGIVTQAYGASTAYAGNKPKSLQVTPGWRIEYPQAFQDAWADSYDNL